MYISDGNIAGLSSNCSVRVMALLRAILNRVDLAALFEDSIDLNLTSCFLAATAAAFFVFLAPKDRLRFAFKRCEPLVSHFIVIYVGKYSSSSIVAIDIAAMKGPCRHVVVKVLIFFESCR